MFRHVRRNNILPCAPAIRRIALLTVATVAMLHMPVAAEYEAMDVDDGGSITGRVLFKGGESKTLAVDTAGRSSR